MQCRCAPRRLQRLRPRHSAALVSHRPPPRQGLEWFAALLREDDDGDVADEFLIEAACAAQEEPAAAECRGALRTLAVTRRPRRPPAWQRVVGGWPLCADVAA